MGSKFQTSFTSFSKVGFPSLMNTQLEGLSCSATHGTKAESCCPEPTSDYYNAESAVCSVCPAAAANQDATGPVRRAEPDTTGANHPASAAPTVEHVARRRPAPAVHDPIAAAYNCLTPGEPGFERRPDNYRSQRPSDFGDQTKSSFRATSREAKSK